MVNLRPALAATLCGESTPSPLLVFLMRRLRTKAFDDIKGYAAELLSILLQADVGTGAVARVVGAGPFVLPDTKGGSASASGPSIDGVEYLLECANVYKKRAPGNAAEEECVENVFDAICTLLLVPDNQTRFRRAEGTELMIRMMAEASFARYGALKVLSYAVAAQSGRNCEALIDAGGLKEVFPAFMGKGTAHTRKLHGLDAAKDEEQRAISIVASCMDLLPFPSPSLLATGKLADPAFIGPGGGVHRLRVLAKFKEGGHEKIDRLVELIRRYEDKVAAAAADESDDDDDDEEGYDASTAARIRDLKAEARYLRRLDAGLFVLQQAGSILAHLVAAPLEIAQGAASAAAAAAGGSGAREASAAASVSASVSVHPSIAKLCEDVSFAARSKLYEQGGTLVAVVEVLQEQSDRLAASSASASAGSGSSASAGVSSDATRSASLSRLVQCVRAVALPSSGSEDSAGVGSSTSGGAAARSGSSGSLSASGRAMDTGDADEDGYDS